MNLVSKRACHYVGIPAFPSHLFRHPSIHIRKDRGIERLQDLRGNVVGVPEYQMTAAVWIRVILQDEYGVRQRGKVAQWRARTAGPRAARAPEIARRIELQPIPANETLADHLDSGRIDPADSGAGAVLLRPQHSGAAAFPGLPHRGCALFPAHRHVSSGNRFTTRAEPPAPSPLGGTPGAPSRYIPNYRLLT
jgi:hypothetical protein